MSMRVWVDGQCLQTPSRLRGIGRYVQDLIRATAEYHPDIELLISFNAAMTSEAIVARDFIQRWIRPENIHVWQGVCEGGEAVKGYTARRRLSELALAHHVRSLDPDVALSASPFEGNLDVAAPLLAGELTLPPIAAIFYDAIPHRFPEHYLTSAKAEMSYRRRFENHRRFDINLCISNFSREEALALFPEVPAIDISAGLSTVFVSAIKSDNSKRAVAPHGKYVLYAGGLDWRKNVALAVDAIALLPDSWRREVKFVLAGNQPANLLDPLRELWRSHGLPADKFVPLGHVSDQHLISLYRSANLVVQPSLMEGFGLTSLEAMMCGAPVAGAAAGAIPEVIGEADFLFDPMNAGELSALIGRVLTEDAFARRMVANGHRQAARFTWERSAKTALDAMKDLIAERPRGSVAREISVARKQCLAAMGKTEVALDISARVFALAEPLRAATPRLIVDATATLRSDLKSGIQRVVKAICANLSRCEDRELERVVAFSDCDEGWRRVTILGNGELGSVDGSPEGRVVFRGGDTILMLDSSWGLSKVHRRSLLSARLRGAEIVSCLYDMVPLSLQAFCGPNMPGSFSRWFKGALSYSTGFVCISRAVADELHALLTAVSFPRPMKIGYWRLGADFVDAPIDRHAISHVEKTTPTFLMVGTLEPRKGHRVALDAFEALWAEGFDVRLIIAGKHGWGVDHLAEEIRTHREFGARLFWHEQVGDVALAQLYSECDALIAASFAEGFGLPIVEAGRFGNPVIASDIPVFREVGHGVVERRFFRVGSSADLAETVRTFVAEQPHRSFEQFPNAGWLTWAESARELDNVVMGGNWYCTYRPTSDEPYATIDDLGQVQMKEPVPSDKRGHRLEHVEGPIPIDGGINLKYVVRVSNLSDKTWSSEGPNGRELGIFLGYHILAADGSIVGLNNPRTTIPFVHVPGSAHYVSIVVPVKWRDEGGEFVDIELVQEGVGRWGSPLRAPLS